MPLSSPTPRNLKSKIALTFIIHRKVAWFELSKVPKKLRESNKVHAASWEIQNKPWINADFASICRLNSTDFESKWVIIFPCNQLTIFFPRISASEGKFGAASYFFYSRRCQAQRPKSWVTMARINIFRANWVLFFTNKILWTTKIFVLIVNSRTLSRTF